jgi:methionyl aminopeptidase
MPAGQPAVRYLRHVERHVTANGFSVVREFVGTASGRRCTKSRRFRITVDRRERESALKEGMVLAIEPMVNAGKPGAGPCPISGRR